MNTRIRLLADEAAKFSAIMTLPTGESGDKLFVEKFAELIVRECVMVASNPHLNDEESYYGNEFAKAIKKHFGVRE